MFTSYKLLPSLLFLRIVSDLFKLLLNFKRQALTARVTAKWTISLCTTISRNFSALFSLFWVFDAFRRAEVSKISLFWFQDKPIKADLTDHVTKIFKYIGLKMRQTENVRIKSTRLFLGLPELQWTVKIRKAIAKFRNPGLKVKTST